MTCVVGLLSGGKVYLGGDSCGSDSYTYENCNHPKVFKVGEFIIGGTTSFRMLDLLEYSLVIPEGRPTKLENMDKFMRTTFVDLVRSCLKNGGFCKIDNSVDQGGTFLIGYKDQLFRMQNDFSIITQVDYDVVGCGDAAAKGSLFTTKDVKMSVENRITKALESAESVVIGVKAPFHIIST
jgi:hypothetical protein